MPRCSQCGAEHDLLEPAFRRPEAYVQLGRAAREAHSKADDDLCRITLPRQSPRYFVRGVLTVDVRGVPEGVGWGLWAEVPKAAFLRVVELWSAHDQATEAPFRASLANVIPAYPDTLGLALELQLTGPTSRPELRFSREVEHPFARECEAGVDPHRVSEWSAMMGAPALQ